jgi:hypothetical protein
MSKFEYFDARFKTTSNEHLSTMGFYKSRKTIKCYRCDSKSNGDIYEHNESCLLKSIFDKVYRKLVLT